MASSAVSPDHSPVTKAGAGTAVGWMSVAAVITIIVTRAYLLLTGYPQVGGDVFHIAHAVWGGLLLMVALTLVLAVSNRWANAVGAITGGIGAGLFVDEIGKFITQDNDYFFPLAAPLCYALLAGLAVLAMRVGSKRPPSARDHLYAAMELSKSAADGPLTHRQIEVIEEHLDAVRATEPKGQERALLDGLTHALDAARPFVVPDEARRVGRIRVRLRRFEERVLPPHRQRTLSRVALGLLALVGIIAGPGVLVYALWQVFGPAPIGNRNSLLGDDPGAVAWSAAALAGVIGTAAAVFAWRAVRRLGESGDVRQGVRAGIVALVLLLGGVNLLNSYFNQFWVLVDASAQAGVLGLLLRMRDRFTSHG